MPDIHKTLGQQHSPDLALGFGVMLDACSRMIAEMGEKLKLISELDSEYLDCLYGERIEDLRTRLSLVAMERDELEKLSSDFDGLNENG